MRPLPPPVRWSRWPTTRARRPRGPGDGGVRFAPARAAAVRAAIGPLGAAARAGHAAGSRRSALPARSCGRCSSRRSARRCSCAVGGDPRVDGRAAVRVGRDRRGGRARPGARGGARATTPAGRRAAPSRGSRSASRSPRSWSPAVATGSYARGEGGTLGLVDYLLTTFGPFVPGEAVIAALAAWWGANAGPVQALMDPEPRHGHRLPPPDRGRLLDDRPRHRRLVGRAEDLAAAAAPVAPALHRDVVARGDRPDGRLAGFLIGFHSPDQRRRRLLPHDRDEPEPAAPRRRRERCTNASSRMPGRPAGHEVMAVTWPGNRVSIAFHRALGFEIAAGPGSQNLYGTPSQAGYDFDREDRTILVRRSDLTGRDSVRRDTARASASSRRSRRRVRASATTCRATRRPRGRRLLRRPDDDDETVEDVQHHPCTDPHTARCSSSPTTRHGPVPEDNTGSTSFIDDTCLPAFNDVHRTRLSGTGQDYDIRRLLRRPGRAGARATTRSSASSSGSTRRR